MHLCTYNVYTCIILFNIHVYICISVLFRFHSNNMYRIDIVYICRLCELTLLEMIEFLGPDRTHMQQGTFADVQQSYLLRSQLRFDEVLCKVLIGAPLKQNEFLKIDQTCFSEVISDETGNEQLKQESPITKTPGEGEGEGKAVTFAKETEEFPKQEEGLVSVTTWLGNKLIKSPTCFLIVHVYSVIAYNWASGSEPN